MTLDQEVWFTTKALSEECMCNSAHVLFLDRKGWAWRDKQREEERLMSSVKICVKSTLAREVGLETVPPGMILEQRFQHSLSH